MNEMRETVGKQVQKRVIQCVDIHRQIEKQPEKEEFMCSL